MDWGNSPRSLTRVMCVKATLLIGSFTFFVKFSGAVVNPLQGKFRETHTLSQCSAYCTTQPTVIDKWGWVGAPWHSSPPIVCSPCTLKASYSSITCGGIRLLYFFLIYGDLRIPGNWATICSHGYEALEWTAVSVRNRKKWFLTVGFNAIVRVRDQWILKGAPGETSALSIAKYSSLCIRGKRETWGVTYSGPIAQVEGLTPKNTKCPLHNWFVTREGG